MKLTEAQRRLLHRTRARGSNGWPLGGPDTRPAQTLIRLGLAWRRTGPRPTLFLTRTGKAATR